MFIFINYIHNFFYIQNSFIILFIFIQYQLIIQEGILLCQCLRRNTSSTEIFKVLKILLIVYPGTIVLIISLMVQKQWWVKLSVLAQINAVSPNCIVFFTIMHSQLKKKASLKNLLDEGTSLVVQRLRIHLPMQGTRVQSLFQEDPTCRGTTRPVSHNY